MNLIQNYVYFPQDLLRKAQNMAGLLVHNFRRLSEEAYNGLKKTSEHVFLWDPFEDENSLNKLAKKMLLFILAQGSRFNYRDPDSLMDSFRNSFGFSPQEEIILPYFIKSSHLILSQLPFVDYSILEDAFLDIVSRTINKLFNERNRTNQTALGFLLYENVYELFKKKKTLITNKGFSQIIVQKTEKLLQGRTLKSS